MDRALHESGTPGSAQATVVGLNAFELLRLVGDREVGRTARAAAPLAWGVAKLRMTRRRRRSVPRMLLIAGRRGREIVCPSGHIFVRKWIIPRNSRTREFVIRSTS